MSVCVSSNFFHIANFPTVFSDSHETCTHDLCTKMQKTMEQVFKFLLLKFVDNFFLNFTLGLSYWKQQLWSYLRRQCSLAVDNNGDHWLAVLGR